MEEKLYISIDGSLIQGTYSTPEFPNVKSSFEKIEILFNKYFPYDNGNGQPIYNENTGAELRDPETGF